MRAALGVQEGLSAPVTSLNRATELPLGDMAWTRGWIMGAWRMDHGVCRAGYGGMPGGMAGMDHSRWLNDHSAWLAWLAWRCHEAHQPRDNNPWSISANHDTTDKLDDPGGLRDKADASQSLTCAAPSRRMSPEPSRTIELPSGHEKFSWFLRDGIKSLTPSSAPQSGERVASRWSTTMMGITIPFSCMWSVWRMRNAIFFWCGNPSTCRQVQAQLSGERTDALGRWLSCHLLLHMGMGMFVKSVDE